MGASRFLSATTARSCRSSSNRSYSRIGRITAERCPRASTTNLRCPCDAIVTTRNPDYMSLRPRREGAFWGGARSVVFPPRCDSLAPTTTPSPRRTSPPTLGTPAVTYAFDWGWAGFIPVVVGASRELSPSELRVRLLADGMSSAMAAVPPPDGSVAMSISSTTYRIFGSTRITIRPSARETRCGSRGTWRRCRPPRATRCSSLA